MLRIQILSDLHFDHHLDKGRSFLNSLSSDKVDVLVLAGDIDNSYGIIKSLTKICEKYKNSRIIYVMGNHCVYGSSFAEVDKKLAKLETMVPNLTWLENKSIEIEGQRFIGSTLWFPDSPEARSYKSALSDFRVIENFERDVYPRNVKSVQYLKDNIQKNDIVITHHLPSYKCVHQYYKNSLINCYWVCEMGGYIVGLEPKFWVYGHGHNPMKTVIGKTLMINNAFGYPGSISWDFNLNLILEVKSKTT